MKTSAAQAALSRSVLASPVLAACADDSTDTTDVGTNVSDTAGDTASDVLLLDSNAQLMYGMPPQEDVGPASDAMEDAESPPDIQNSAAYGMPPQEDVAPPEPDGR